MGQQNPKYQFILNYYDFQKKIQKYLSDWEKEKGGKLEKGYIIHPDWIKEWKRISNYNNIKTKYLDKYNSESKFLFLKKDNQKYKKIENLEKESDYDFNLICYVPTVDFLPTTQFFSLEYLENIVNEETYKLLDINIINLQVKDIKYILKKRMFIILDEAENIIKIILKKENENDILINLNFIFDNKDSYKKYSHFFENKYSKEIYNFIEDIINTKKKEYLDKKNIHFKIEYEEKKYINNEKKIEKNVSPLPDEEEINVHFQSEDQKINKTIHCNKNDIFISVLGQFPDIKDNYNKFIVNGKNININSTFNQNNIKDGDNILIY